MNGLGIDKAPRDTRVVVAMSGGVDSSVTAALLAEAGYEVVGVTLQLYDHGAATAKAKACCAGQDIHDARRVAERLGIPHYVLGYERRFREAVMERFAASYQAGETPIPCVLCNQTVKFTDLLDTARDLGADALATGHYVRRVDGPSGPELRRAADPTRDQSYFLFATTRDQLSFLRFPLGAMRKDEVREAARRFDLPVAAKPDSQDICFVPDGRYADIVEKLRPGAGVPGDIVDADGLVLGRHRGLIRYTVGQRRGLALDTADEALYVLALDREANRVVVGPRAALGRTRVILRDLNWIGASETPADGQQITVKLRSTQPPVAARLRPDRAGGAEIALDAPAESVAPGQACVFYDSDRVLGGGWIAGSA